MADTTLNILIRAVYDAKKVIDTVVSDLNKVKTSYEDINKATVTATTSQLNQQKATETSSAALKDLGSNSNNIKDFFSVGTDGANKLKSAISGVIGVVKLLTGGILAVAGVGVIKGFADAAARVQVLGTVLGVVGSNAGFTSSELKTADSAVQKLGITAESSAESLTKFIQAGLDVNLAPKLARAAQDLAVISGSNSSETFSRLLLNIQQLDTVGLRFQGIVIDRERALQTFAAQINKNVDDLSTLEKRQAVLNAVLAESSKLAGVYAAAMGDVGKQLTSLPRLTGALAQSLGAELLPAYSAIVAEISLFLENARLTVDANRLGTTSAEELGEAVGGALSVFRSLTDVFGFVAAGVQKIVVGWALLANTEIFKRVVKGISDFASAIGIAVSGVGTLISLFSQGLAVVLEELSLKWDQITLRIDKATLAWNEFFNSGTADERNAEEARIKAVEKELELRRQALDNTDVQAKEFTDPRIEQLKILADREKELNEQLLTAQKEVNTANRAGNVEEKNRADYKLNQVKISREANQLEQDLLKTQLDIKTVIEQQNDKKSIQAKINAKVVATETEVNEALKALVDPEKFKVGRDGIEQFSVEGSASIGRLGKVYSAFVNKTVGDTGSILVPNLATVRVALSNAFAALSTPDDFTRFIKEVSALSKDASEQVQALTASADFRRQQAGLKQLNNELQGYISSAKELQAIQQAYNNLVLQGASNESAYARVVAETNNNRAAVVAIETQIFDKRAATANLQFQQEVSLARQQAEVKSRLATEEIQNVTTRASVLNAIEKESLGSRLKSSQDYYKSLQGFLKDWENKFKQAADRVKAIDASIRENAKTTASQIRDIERQGLSPSDAFDDRLREYGELLEQFKTFTASTDKAVRAETESRLKTLISEIAKGGGKESADELRDLQINSLQEVSAEKDRILKQEKAQAVKEETAARDKLKDIANELVVVGEEIKTIFTEQVGRIKLSINEESLASVIKDLETKFGELILKPRLETPDIVDLGVRATAPDQAPILKESVTQGVIEGFVPAIRTFEEMKRAIDGLVATLQSRPIGASASGGIVPGVSLTGREDNVLTWLTPSEFVQPVKAVQHYGRDFMESIRTLNFPKFAAGGVVGSIPVASFSPASANDGPVMSLDLSFNRKSVGRVSGSRDTVRGLVGALKEVSRGTA